MFKTQETENVLKFLIELNYDLLSNVLLIHFLKINSGDIHDKWMHKSQSCLSQLCFTPPFDIHSFTFIVKIPGWPCLNLCQNILSFAMNSGLACVFSAQKLIIAALADARLPLDGTYRKCCDRGPMTGKETKLVCEYINVFSSNKLYQLSLQICCSEGN